MQSSTISICLVKCLLIPRDQNILMNLNLLYYPWSMYPGKHGEAQFCPILNCFAKPQNEAMLAAKSGWTLGQVLVLSSLPMPSNLQPCNQWVCKTGNARVKHMLKCTPLLHCTLFIILSLPPILYLKWDQTDPFVTTDFVWQWCFFFFSELCIQSVLA